MNFLIYILIGWGITDILVNGSIFNEIRNYFLVKFPSIGKLFSCVQCSGFWVGILMGILFYSDFIFPPFEKSHFISDIFISGALISGSCVIINATIFFFIQKGNRYKI
jgi:hypothetical protein